MAINMLVVRLFVLIALIASSQASSAASEKWLNESRGILDRAKVDRSKASVLELTDRIRSSGRLLNESDAIEVELHRDLINGAISIPGHAQYMADALREERDAELRSEPNFYVLHRVFYIKETLPHLPSPETIRVLGEFLSDDLDKRVRARGSDFIPTPANSVLAAQALSKIGLRNAPMPRQNDAEEKNLAPWREWWAKVKSGEQAFSFEKQEVEYVFQKDGSVASRPRNGAPRPRNAPVIATPVVPSASSVTWPYWLSGGLVAIAAVWWLLVRRTRRLSQSHPE